MLDQDSTPTVTPSDYWRAILRRKWLAITLFTLCVMGAGILSVALPKSYRSSTLILVEGQKIPENYVQAVIGPTIEERLNSLQQQIMSRTVLTRVIDEFGLYPKAVRSQGIDGVIERVRKDIKVETMGARSQRGGGIDAFSISFAHQNPTIAMKVTAKLASQFIEENLKVREQLVEGASEFLSQELELAKKRLEAQEEALGSYRTRYMGELPEQIQSNLSALDRLQSQHTAASEALNRMMDRLALTDRMIREYESPVISGGADPLVARLIDLERTLMALSAEYKESYPDILHLKQEIQSIKTQLKGRRGLEKEPNGSKGYTDLYLRELLRQRDEAKLEIAALKNRIERTKLEMSEYERRVEKAPTREQELDILVRDYNNLKENYRNLLDKKLNARLAENLEKRQKGEQFRIIDPANLPNRPDKPDRMKIMLLGVLLGCGLGGGTAIGLDLLRPVFRRSEDIERLLHLRVIASIPSFKSLVEQVQKRLSAGPMGQAGDAKNRPLTSSMLAGEQPVKHTKGLVVGKTGTTSLVTRQRTGRANLLRELELIGKWNPMSVVAEQFRVAATRLALLQSGGRGNVVVITSSVKGEGKSVVAANLAYSLARDMGKRTLLIDGDLKCSTVHQYWGILQSPGLRNILQGSHSVDSCLRQEGELPLWILPAGVDRGRAVGDRSRGNGISEIVGELKERFDFILIDAPPVLPLADMHVMAGMADMVAFVIRAGLTPRNIVDRALQTLGTSTHNMCTILNGLEAGGLPYYMKEGYEYFGDRKSA
jgi:polysaccharide biosynthesis transport protein